MGGGSFVLGYVIYGLIAIFLVLIPNALAFWFAADVPFPTLYRCTQSMVVSALFAGSTVKTWPYLFLK